MTISEAPAKAAPNGAVTTAASGKPSSQGATRPDLHYEPALDGLRGLAVVAVVAFHLGHIDGGFLGVDLFFALSGFLITSLLLVERQQHPDRSRRTLLSQFWLRRIRRLVPALLLFMAGVAVLILTLTPAEQRPEFRADGLYTLFYLANWNSFFSDSSYWDMFSQPSPLDHAWSLAIEEQFYVFWPLVFLAAAWLARRRGTGTGNVIAAVSAIGAVASFGLLAVTYNPLDTNHAYYGTHTRIGPTLLGAVLAVVSVRRARREGPPSRALDSAALIALAGLVLAMVQVNGNEAFYYRGGLVAFTLGALVVIFAVTGGPPGWTGRCLSLRPLRALGLISYGLYLWHWPVIVYLDPTFQDWLPQGPRNVDVLGRTVNLTDVGLDGLRVVLSLALAITSYKLLEQPIRHRVWEKRWGGRRLAVAGVAATVLVVAMVLVATRDTTETPGGAAFDMDRETVYPEELPDDTGNARLLLVGDSGALRLGPGLMDHAAGQDVPVAFAADPECTVIYPEGTVLHESGETDGAGPCHDRRWEEITSAVDEFEPDVVVYYFANAGMLDYLLDGDVVDDCDPAYTDYLETALTDELAYFQDEGVEVVILTTPYIHTFDQTSAPRVDCRNEVYSRLAAGPYTPDVVDLNGWIADRGDNRDIYSDWVHFSHEGAVVVSEWLLPEILTG